MLAVKGLTSALNAVDGLDGIHAQLNDDRSIDIWNLCTIRSEDLVGPTAARILVNASSSKFRRRNHHPPTRHDNEHLQFCLDLAAYVTLASSFCHALVSTKITSYY